MKSPDSRFRPVLSAQPGPQESVRHVVPVVEVPQQPGASQNGDFPPGKHVSEEAAGKPGGRAGGRLSRPIGVREPEDRETNIPRLRAVAHQMLRRFLVHGSGYPAGRPGGPHRRAGVLRGRRAGAYSRTPLGLGAPAVATAASSDTVPITLSSKSARGSSMLCRCPFAAARWKITSASATASPSASGSPSSPCRNRTFAAGKSWWTRSKPCNPSARGGEARCETAADEAGRAGDENPAPGPRGVMVHGDPVVSLWASSYAAELCRPPASWCAVAPGRRPSGWRARRGAPTSGQFSRWGPASRIADGEEARGRLGTPTSGQSPGGGRHRAGARNPRR